MNILQSKSSSNGSSHRRGEREGVSNKAQSIKSQPEKTPNTDGDAGSLGSSLRDRLVYLATCKIGHHVEAHLKNGTVYSGIFHAADVEKDFGIILKMASLIRDGTLRGPKSRYEFVRKPPSKTFIIPADELVQVVAKDLSISRDASLNVVQSEKLMELLTDSSISQSSHVDMGRELKPWVPDAGVPERPDLENVGWNQFKVNEKLFGVTTTFDEELYTTKLQRGPRTRELEEHAVRIAREIEGENTRDLHVAEERGLQLNEKYDIDEETKYSSVRPADVFDDSGFDEEDDKLLDTCNDLTFGGSSTSDGQKPASSGKGYEELQGDSQSSRNNTNVDQKEAKETISQGDSQSSRNNAQPSVESVSGHEDNNEGAKSGGGATSTSKVAAERESQVSQVSGKTKSESSIGQSASRSSESRPAPSTSSRPGLSPSSSIGSTSSSGKSRLNPSAQEFKLNPNAKSYIPAQQAAPARPQSPIPEASFYYPVPVQQQMPGMPSVGYGIAPQYPGQQPVMYHHTPTYYPPNVPAEYRQQQEQMMYGPPRPGPGPGGYMLPPPPYQPGMPPYN
ncbi:unnamed protein product [Arabis nemorensis]|uniref:LsmAD domain-containing protein n=1 Tax=Arabis nemorensis TaxID=586526 RepID=A0A565B9S9_9BRAS|nr:unnamed protein product [Arabis nemorensis]